MLKIHIFAAHFQLHGPARVGRMRLQFGSLSCMLVLPGVKAGEEAERVYQFIFLAGVQAAWAPILRAV